MPENPYQPPKEEPEQRTRERPSAELVLAYVIGIPLVAMLIVLALGAWVVIQMSD